jgi:glucose/arabinose dehydrogenase
MHSIRRYGLFALVFSLVFIIGVPARAAVPSGFSESAVISGLINPTVIRFAPDGRVFVGEKRGVIKVYPSISNTTPTTLVDLRTSTYNFWDRGLLGMALDPNFSTNHFMYVLYTYDALIGGTAPKWGTANTDSDPCPDPPGATTNGCVVSARLSKLTLSGNTVTNEQVLVNDWCQQFPSHSIGSLEFGPDGALYVSAGDGASFGYADYGQTGNPCNDPVNEGGSLRSQDLRTSGDPVGLDGSILRLDPATGAAMSGNPLIGNADLNARRIVSYGLRNPFRITVRPGTNEIWIGDVGNSTWEEINRIVTPTAGVLNYGWPCYEGAGIASQFQAVNMPICNNLYANPSAVSAPYYTYNHNSTVVPGESCPAGSSSISGLAFDTSSTYPASYNGALFFSDYSRNCIWVMRAGSNGLPDPNQIQTFDAGAAGPVYLTFGPDGALYYPAFDTGEIRRIQASGGTPPPSGNFITRTSGGSITDGSGNVWTLNSSGQIYENGQVNPGGDGTAAVSYVPATGTVWGQDSASGNWYIWNGSIWTGPYLATASGQQPPIPTASLTANPTTVTSGQASMLTWNSTTANTCAGVNFSTGGAASGSLSVTPSISTMYKVTCSGPGGVASTTATVTVGGTTQNRPPTPTISIPLSTLTWKVGDTIQFAGSASDPEDGTLSASRLSWTINLQHCPSNCHTHVLQTFTGVASSSFVAPDHEYPSYIQIVLTATDSKGAIATTSVNIQPKTVNVSLASNPTGLTLTAGTFSKVTPYTQAFILGGAVGLAAPATQSLNGHTYQFVSWSDGGAAAHTTTANASATYTATYQDTSTTTPPAGYTGQYWNAGTGTAPTFPTSAPTLTRTDPSIAFDWGTGSPAAGINADHFMARWSKTASFTAGTYTFTATADDGVRVYVDNTLIIDHWIDEGATTYSVNRAMTAGNHTLKIEYYENAGGAVAKFSYAVASQTQVVLTPTSGGSITDAQGSVWTLHADTCVYKNNVAVPDGCGTSQLTYVNSTQRIWGQDSASGSWYYWDGTKWVGPSQTSPIGQP